MERFTGDRLCDDVRIVAPERVTSSLRNTMRVPIR